MKGTIFLVMLCVASVSCVDLKNICTADSFEYKGVLVNAFHRVQRNVTFESIGHYLIDNTVNCDPSEFQNKTNFWETLKLKHEFNRKFVGLYTEALDRNTPDEIMSKSLEMRRSWEPLTQIAATEDKAKCVKSFERAAYSAWGVFRLLERASAYNLHPIDESAHFKPTNSEEIEILRKLMDELKDGTDSQTFAFRNDTAQDVNWQKAIIVTREFKFLKEGSAGVGPDSKGMLIYHQILPFNNKNHDNNNCVAVIALPRFYKSRGQ